MIVAEMAVAYSDLLPDVAISFLALFIYSFFIEILSTSHLLHK